MSRFEPGGHEGPNPIEALPSAFVSDAPAYLISLPNGEDFIPAVYMSFGYTHYEVSCIGAAGGLGGELRGAKLNYGINFEWTTKWETMPTNVWNAYIAVQVAQYGEPFLVQFKRPDGSGIWDEFWMNQREYHERINPGHIGQVTYWKNPTLTDPIAWGGGGGGGGLQVVAGVLADLPAAVPVVVGQAGADGAYGHYANGGLHTAPSTWTPLPENVKNASLTPLAQRPYWVWADKYPLPNPSFPIPQAGANGGKSSFNGTTCVASGGKGGKAATGWDGALFLDGAGGEGGLGGRSAAGGGALGGTLADRDAADGLWDGEIGQGGGGGRGGAFYPENPSHPRGFFWNELNNEWWAGYVVPSLPGRNAGDGGQGSFSYADTSVFGARQRKQAVVMVIKSGSYSEDLIMHTGVPLGMLDYNPKPPPLVPYSVIGGGGGGASRGNWKFGSHALGYSPNGAVLIRVYKVE